jgi:3-dehydroquinate dehydratase
MHKRRACVEIPALAAFLPLSPEVPMLSLWRRSAWRRKTVVSSRAIGFVGLGAIGFVAARALQTEVESQQKKRGRSQR